PIVAQVAADTFDHPRCALDAELDRAYEPGGRARDLIEKGAQSLAVFAAPKLGKSLAGDLFRLQAEGTRGCGRGETYHPVGADDHDDIRGVRDQRRVVLLCHAKDHRLAE